MELTLLRFSLFLFFVARLNLNAPNKRDHSGLPKRPTPVGACPEGVAGQAPTQVGAGTG